MSNARDAARQAAELQARRKKERRLLIIVAAALVLIVVAGGIIFQLWQTNRAPTAEAGVVGPPIPVDPGKPLVLGDAGAPVKLALYEDFHCPHCADFEEQFGPTIEAAQQAGTVAVELYPLAFIDEGSVSSANAMACSAAAGFGQAYYDGLFANHTLQWSDDQLIDLASKIGGDPAGEFTTCVTGKAQAAWVDSIALTATKNGVEGTPTVFINGELVAVNGLTPEALQAQIDEAAK